MQKMSSTAAHRMNLAALQRVDSAISEIVDTASQVALYKFSSAAGGWERTEIEGALFVFSWTRLPCNGLLVMNRLNTTNFLEPITQDFEFHVQSPFLLYKKSSSDIYGVWFYEEKECNRIGEVCQSLAKMPNRQARGRQRCMSESDSHGKATGTQNGEKSRDIVSLLARAKDQYDMKKSEANTNGPHGGGRSRSRKQPSSATRNGTIQQVNGQHKPVTNGQASVLKPTPVRAATNSRAEPPTQSTPLSVESLFSAAMCAQRGPNTPETCRPSSVGVSECTVVNGKGDVLQELLSNPANLLEHVERVQRNESDAVEISPRQRAQSCSVPSAARQVEQDLRHKLKLEEDACTDAKTSLITPAMLERGVTRLGKSVSPTTSLLSPLMRQQNGIPPPASELPLLSPMAFTKSSSSTLLNGSASPVPKSFVQPEVPYLNGDDTQEPLVPLRVLSANPAPVTLNRKQERVTPLTKEQIREALVHMLQTDDDFLLKIHEAYISSLRSRFSLGFL
ncbi:mRNA-decapping enzyme 1A-like [Ornithodoros turicata]|uniref:mRNA-decapping enzyme 1A-like n=1 Tax=Ornithodoros turicata TaxID=34597 RepID=UPI003139F5D5